MLSSSPFHALLRSRGRLFSKSLYAANTRSFTSSFYTKKQFVLIAHDYTDPEALTRRSAVRQAHLSRTKEMKEKGLVHFGGALLSSNTKIEKMNGSLMVFEAETEEDVRALIETDPYVTGKVWERWNIFPFKMAFK
ncbi:hypothetical protein G9A89_008882 [Geosiphon pyriformis]|nr:hypothetical protein G9A89_008882 [Geosiphon pyriformis]